MKGQVRSDIRCAYSAASDLRRRIGDTSTFCAPGGHKMPLHEGTTVCHVWGPY